MVVKQSSGLFKGSPENENATQDKDLQSTTAANCYILNKLNEAGLLSQPLDKFYKLTFYLIDTIK